MLTAESLAKRATARVTGQRATSGISFTAFKHRFWPKYIHTPFHAIIDDYLTSVFNYLQTGDGISRLMIFMPPRYGKTQSVSRHYPAWVLGNDPDISIISVSYGARLAQKNSRAVRNLIQRQDYQALYPHTRLKQDKKAVDEWGVEGYEGGLVTAGVRGGVTGFGGRLIIIDDPIKNRADAESETIREQTHDWYDSDLYTRLEDLEPSAIIIINTRWHFDDLSGYLLADDVDGWTVLNFPALTTPENVDQDSLGRDIGVPLWPRKHSVDDLAQKQAQLGEYAYESLFQQNPSQTKGRLFDTAYLKANILEEHDIPDLQKVVRFYDLAITKKSRASYTVGVKLGIAYDNTFVVLDVYRHQKEAPDVEADIKATAQLDGSSTPIILEGEKGGMIELQYLHRDAAMNAYTMELRTPDGDKYTRATPVASKVNAGRVLIVRGAWNKAFLEELAMFPGGKWDDQVDALSGAYKELETEIEMTPLEVEGWSEFRGI